MGIRRGDVGRAAKYARARVARLQAQGVLDVTARAPLKTWTVILAALEVAEIYAAVDLVQAQAQRTWEAWKHEQEDQGEADPPARPGADDCPAPGGAGGSGTAA